MEQKTQKSKVDEMIETLEKECIKSGLTPPKRVEKTGTFVIVKRPKITKKEK